MKITRKEFNESWAIEREAYKEDCKYPFFNLEIEEDWGVIPEEYEDITKAGRATSYNAAINQNSPGDEYSYEVGYFKAFKLIAYFAKEDSDSFVMPAIFIVRHFIELTLKNLIFNLSIVLGEPIKINKNNTHNLKELKEEVYKIASKYKLSPLMDNNFLEIINQLSEISPKSDEYRYPTNQSGEWNLKNNTPPSHIINLITLNHNMNYFYLLTQSLLILITNSSDSIFEGTVYTNPFVIELIKIITNKRFPENIAESQVQDRVIGVIDSYNLPLEKAEIRCRENNSGIEVIYGDLSLFTITGQGENLYLKTEALIIE
ncbi:hypothetical protein LMB39_00245 [Limosilactobacillus reuteri]|uniref:hypothetical protein n=1 Tax=Limosilactobacillus reuteri TaxID=1598 RepID=UPI001E38A02D|nr:hypothetical protein [Limosilactobacillus reuteri]MCC4347054.1 hypothetical protein [Limosilactobacillus reuteri]MCC4374060.1 hypothetical protein [Limosilactobacillus reuteri]MCC4384358.1 hypothetical protein [Limosilactobacillus reuteri]